MRVDRLVRVVVGQRFERQHLAGIDVHDHSGRGLGPKAVHAGHQFVAQRMRQPEVERQPDGLQAFRVDDEAGHVRVRQTLLVEIFLHAGDADVVLVDIAEHVRADRAIGIDALVLGEEADARKAEMKDLGPLFRRDLPLDPDEALSRAEPLAQLLGVDVRQNGGDEFDRLVLVDDAIGLGEDRHGLHVGRQDLAVAVEQVRPRAGNGLVGRAFQRLRRIMRDPEHDELHPEHGERGEHAERKHANARARPVEPGQQKRMNERFRVRDRQQGAQGRALSVGRRRFEVDAEVLGHKAAKQCNDGA